MRNTNNTRNTYLDVMKGIGILLVVLGHCIQYGSGSGYLDGAFFDNPVFKFIYSYHMPFFMLISGYLFAYSCEKKKWYELLIVKFKQLIIPLACFSVVSLLIAIVKEAAFGASEVISVTWIAKTLFQSFVYGPWFLWALWWCSLAVILVRRFFRDSVWIYVLGTLLTFVLPDSYNLQMYKFMWPFFLLAYLFCANDYQNKLKSFYTKKWMPVLLGVVFIGLLCFYNYDIYIYNSGFTVLGKDVLTQTGINIFRFVVGLTGSIFVMYLIAGLMKIMPEGCGCKRALAFLGQNTIGIYILSGMLITEGLSKVTASLHGVNYLLVVVEVLVVLLLSLILNAVLKRFQVTRQLFLGGR